jgi:hypothetical protein
MAREEWARCTTAGTDPNIVLQACRTLLAEANATKGSQDRPVQIAREAFNMDTSDERLWAAVNKEQHAQFAVDGRIAALEEVQAYLQAKTPLTLEGRVNMLSARVEETTAQIGIVVKACVQETLLEELRPAVEGMLSRFFDDHQGEHARRASNPGPLPPSSWESRSKPHCPSFATMLASVGCPCI